VLITCISCSQKRKERLKVADKTGKHNFSCVRNINFIFDRAIKKFKADISIWLEWISFAKAQSSHK